MQDLHLMKIIQEVLQLVSSCCALFKSQLSFNPNLSYLIFVQDDEFKEILRSAERIEFLYSHLFDEVIVNADLSAAFEQLVRAVNRVENEALWVPASWVQ